ncbi:UPF0481 protein [Senna tora]|uniref:UPF0481 protein n=1 Tax=Senna tora TaxID=362788 RepID=A0A834XG95_9FABA|nr:UPF0481 protein [Senna tora]
MATNGPVSKEWDIMEYLKIENIIEINELKDLKKSSCNIYKVPPSLHKENKDAYTPQSISIGPLHLGKHDHLKPMQEQKLKYYQFFWDRVSDNGDVVIKGHIDFLAAKEIAIRRSYAEKFTFTSEKFIDMLLLDSVFIVELFMRIKELDQMKKAELKEENGYDENGRGETTRTKKCEDGPKHLEEDWILKQTWLIKSVQRDLVLLENQIPFYILDSLYKSIPRNANNEKMPKSFIDLAHDYFACYDPHERFKSQTCENNETTSSESPPSDKSKSSKHGTNVSTCCGSVMKKSFGSSRFKVQEVNPAHFTDLIRYFYLCKDLHMRPSSSSNVLRTATKLQEAGVSFEKVTKRHLLDIKFQKHPFLTWFLCLGCIPSLNHFKARFRIPQLKVDHATECVLRNLIAFEQCHYADQPYVCNYVSLVDSLIHTKDDVELLVEKEVIVHELGSDKEVATLVNGLCKHVVTNSTCYQDIIDGLNSHYQNVWNRTMAALRLVYFRDPWRASSTLVGIAVLVFTIFNFCRVIRVVF